MARKSKLVYVIGSITIGIVSVLLVFATLLLSGVIGVAKTKLVFVSESAEYVYDGTAHSCEEWSIISGQLKDGHTAQVIMASKQTDIGTIDNEMSITILDESKADITDYYEIESHYGQITVIQNNITVVSDNMRKVYDGESLVGTGYVLYGAIAEGSTMDVQFHNQLTDVGTLENAFSVTVRDAEGNDKTSSYNVTSTYGTLEVVKRSIKVSSLDMTKVYDGTALVGNEEYCQLVDGTLVGEDTIRYIFDTDGITNVGKTENDFSATVINARGEDVSNNYKITYGTLGDLEITKRNITVETASAISVEHFHVYNGKVIECETCQRFEVVDGELVEGQNLSAVFEKYIDAGQYENIATFTIKADGQETDLSENYEITTLWGDISIEKLAITLSTPSFPLEEGGHVYDGQVHTTEDTYTLLYDTALAENQTLTIDCLGEALNAGNYVNDANYDILNEMGVSVLHNYLVTTEWGELVILRKDIEISTGSSDPSYIYDGQKVFCHEYQEIIGLVDGESISLDFTETYLIAPGTRENIPVIEILRADGSNSYENYNIISDWGELVVNKRPIIITTNGDEKVYDGIELTKNTQDDWKYGGEYEVIPTHQIIVDIVGKQLDAGSSDNIFEITIYENDVDVTEYYDISGQEGLLKVTPCPLTITTDSITQKYNARELRGTVDADGYLVLDEEGGYTVNGNLNGHTLKLLADANSKITNVGSVSNRGTYTITDADGHDVTHNYNVNFVEGALIVEPIKLNVQSLSYSKEFDGQPLVYDEYRVTGEENLIPDGQNLKIDFNDRLLMTYVTDGNGGRTANAMNVRIVDDNDNWLDQNFYAYVNNYEINKTEGLLQITPRNITFVTNGGVKVFDKTPLEADGYSYLAQGTLLEGHRLNVKCNGTITFISATNGGSVPNTVDYENTTVTDASGEDFTVNYNLSAGYGTLTIKPKPITIKMLSNVPEGDIFYYDGTEYIYERYLQMDGVVGGHELVLVEQSSDPRIFPGTYENKADFVVREGQEDVTLCYDLRVVAGELTINKRPIAIVTDSATKVYDATPLTADGCSIVSGSLVSGHSISSNGFKSITHVRETCENQAVIIIVDDKGTLFTQYYEITVNYGRLEITPCDLTITTDDGLKTYDGTPLTTTAEQVSVVGLCGNDQILAWTPSSITEVGIIDNQIKGLVIGYIDGAETVNNTSDYNIITNYGYLTVQKRELILIAPSNSKLFDGTPLTCDPSIHPYQISVKTPLLDGFEITDIEYIGEQTLIGQSDCTIGGLTIEYDGVEVSNSNFDIVRIDGTLLVYGEDTNGNGGAGEGGEGGDSGESGEGGNGGAPSGDLSDNQGDEIVDVLKVYSQDGRVVYLRQKSYGDFTGKGWSEASEYSGRLYNGQSLNFLPSHALENELGSVYFTLSIQVLNNTGKQYFSPYYEYPNAYYVQTSDVAYTYDSSEPYIVYFYDYDYLRDGVVTPVLSDEEALYRAFVYQNYLGIDNASATYLQSIINRKGWSKNQQDIVKQVAEYIQGSATYNLKYNSKVVNGVTLDQCDNIVVSFLRDYKEGVCRHYASAATLMFRQLGIPARYVVGFMADTRGHENDWLTLNNQEGHAWVEVYIDQLGWVKVEVTGGGSSGDGGSEEKTLLQIRPHNIYAKYDGVTTFDYQSSALGTQLMGTSELVAKGYTFDFTVTGSRKDVGYQDLVISSISVWKDGEDVTDQFSYNLLVGRLQVYEYEVTVTTASASKIFDGTPLTKLDGYTVGNLQAGHSAVVQCTASITNLGTMKNDCVITITDANGQDVTACYKITKVLGELEVSKRQITIIANSDTVAYDENNPITLMNGGYTTSGTLVGGHVLKATVTGSQSSPGYSDNIVSSFSITDGYGQDQTKNYDVTCISGRLTVTLDQE